MKAFLVSALLSVVASAAFAGAERNLPGTPDWQIVYLDLGRAPYQGVTSGRMVLSNQGPGRLSDIRYEVSGVGFSANDNCPRSLEVGQSCKIRVSYWSRIPGYASGRMIVKTSDKKYDVRLNAYGEDDPFKNIPRPPSFPRRP